MYRLSQFIAKLQISFRLVYITSFRPLPFLDPSSALICRKCNPSLIRSDRFFPISVNAADAGGGDSHPSLRSSFVLFSLFIIAMAYRNDEERDPVTGFNYRRLHDRPAATPSRIPAPSTPKRHLPKCYDPNTFPLIETCRAVWLSIGEGNVYFRLDDISDDWFGQWKLATWERLESQLRTESTKMETVTATCVYLRLQGEGVFNLEIQSREDFCSQFVSFIPSFRLLAALTQLQ